MRKAMRWAGVLAAVAAALLFAQPVFAQSAEQIKAATAKSINKLDLQTDLPREQVQKRERWEFNWFKSLGPVGSVWAWLLLGAVAGLFLFAFRDQILTLISSRDPWQKDDAETGALTPEVAARTSAAADELAAGGRFVDAMHLLLLRALTEIRQRLDEHFADSLTSREILRHARLSDPGRLSLRDIVTRVERTYFGEHPAALTDYTACRESFDQFVHALERERST